MSGPLQGLKVIELAGLGPGPFAAMLLADLGAEVVRIDRPKAGVNIGAAALPLSNRGKRTVHLDLKQPHAVQTLLDLVAHADVLVEGYRPGVAERLGVGPAACHARNAKLVYGRVTGWGQDGPLGQVAGHDLNYIALSGVLAAIGPPDKPAIPLNLLGDFAGGSMYLVFGILAALFERQTSGRGQVVDAAMVDGIASLMTSLFTKRQAGTMQLRRESNMLDGGAPFYSLYETADGLWVSIAALEPQFFAALVEAIGLDTAWLSRQHDRAGWPALRTDFAVCFASRTQAEWCAMLEHRDVCFAPVLTIEEAPAHPHHAYRGTYINLDGVLQPAVAPRFDRTPAATPQPANEAATTVHEMLAKWQGR